VAGLADGASKVIRFVIYIPPRRLADGVDTLTALAVDPTGVHSQSAPGPTLTVHPPINVLSETETFVKLADSTATGARVRVVDRVAITNSGSDPLTDPIMIGIYITPDGVPADGAAMANVRRKVTIGAGRTLLVPVAVTTVPPLGIGTYKLVTQLTETDGTITQTDPASAPVINVTVSITGPHFSDTILTVAPMYEAEPSDGTQEFLQSIEFKMSIKNTGSLDNGGEHFSLYASTSPVFDSSAQRVGGPLPLPLVIGKGGVRSFFIDFNLGVDLNDFSGNEIDRYVFVQVTDSAGNVTIASDATPVKFAGLAG